MKTEIKVPTVGESITEATIGSWVKKSGDFVKRNDILLLLETDKASVEVVAENDGILTTQAAEGAVVKIGSTVAILDTDGKASTSAPAAAPAKAAAPAATTAPAPTQPSMNAQTLSPAVNRIVTEKGLDPANINGTGKDGRLTKGDVLAAQPGGVPVAQPAQAKSAPAPVPFVPIVSKQGDKKLVPMTNIRKKIAEKLVQAQHNAAMLTTFNEVDMTKINELRNKYKDSFKEKYGVSLGFMGLFAKASVQALKAFPAVNAYIQGDQMEFHNYFNLGVAVSTEKGLMVPVIKDIDQMSVAQIEMAIREFALKARDGKIGVDDMMNGTFTITNGGVFGSLMSTPILNAPQSAILGMHKVEDRAVVVATAKGKEIVIRPMMYLALSYDHRMIDGKEAVSFLVKIKEGVEDPERLLLEI